MDNQYITLYVNEYGVTPKIHVNQNDSGRTLICQIADMQIPSGSTAIFGATKPSGLGIYNNAVVNGNTVLIKLTDQTLAELGCLKAQIKITNNSETVKTFRFLIDVEEDVTGDHLESENESTFLDVELEQMQQQIDTAVGAAGTATTAANNAAGSANTAASSANAAAQAANAAAETAESVVDDIGNTPITFTQAADRTNLATGDTVKTAFGKITKWFADLGAATIAAFQTVANNLTTTVAGSVLDARQGKILSDNITAAQNALQTQIGDLEDLDTTSKSNVVAAVNELNSNIQNVQDNSYRLMLGTAIPQNADLNDYQSVGNYYCAEAVTAQSLQNMPSTIGFNTAFTLKVELSSGTGYPSQTLRSYNTGNLAYRVYYSSGGWSVWRYILTTTK